MFKKINLFFLGCFLVACAYSNQSNKVWIQNAQKEQLYVQVDGLENAAHHKMAIIHDQAENLIFQSENYVIKELENKDTVIDPNSKITHIDVIKEYNNLLESEEKNVL